MDIKRIIHNEKKVKYIYKSSNPFPKYINGEDENLYLHIYNFLKSGLKNGKRHWPDYIENIKDKKQKSHKKLKFYRKIGFFNKEKNVVNLDNKNKKNNDNNKIEYLKE